MERRGESGQGAQLLPLREDGAALGSYYDEILVVPVLEACHHSDYQGPRFYCSPRMCYVPRGSNDRGVEGQRLGARDRCSLVEQHVGTGPPSAVRGCTTRRIH